MLVQTFYPKDIAPERYDAYLAAGWFRGANMLYKTDILCIERDIHSVINIRLPLQDFAFKKRHRKLLRQNNERFRVEIGPLKTDSERERLYRWQKERFKGFVHNSLVGYLYGGEPRYVFNSVEIAVYDGDTLIAWSCIDKGKKSLASLICLYDPQYARYSLGIYTMLIEIRYAKEQGFQNYYPGYVLDSAPHFDYKLELGDFQLHSGKHWLPYNEEARSYSEAKLIRFKTKQLAQVARQLGMVVKEEINPYFTMAYLNQYAGDLEGLPLYLKHDLNEELSLHIAYDINSGTYVLNQTEPVYDLGIAADQQITNEYSDFSVYSAYPQRLLACLGQSANPSEILELFFELYSKNHA